MTLYVLAFHFTECPEMFHLPLFGPARCDIMIFLILWVVAKLEPHPRTQFEASIAFWTRTSSSRKRF